MTEWLKAGNTAVITGGASGIGLAAARHYAANGMNLVLADQNSDALGEAADSITQLHDEQVVTLVTDVTDTSQVEHLCATALDRFGNVHCLMNNAGASIRQGTPWEDLDKFKQQININFWGVVHGCHAFLPSMLAHGEAAAVINTGSKQGLTKPPGNHAYNISKAGVIAYTESIAHALRNQEVGAVSAHLLIPGFTYTGMIAKFIPTQPEGAWTAEQVVEYMLAALHKDEFYILCPDNETPRALDERRIQWAADDLIQQRPALSRWHPDYNAAYEAFVNDSK